MEHRIGGLEKQHITGNVSYDPDNHEFMVKLRAQKVENIALDIPLQEVQGPQAGDLLVLSWGGTYGACVTARPAMPGRRACRSPMPICATSIRSRPISAKILANYDKVLIPEWNMGQLKLLIRDKYLVDAQGLNKVKGKPFNVEEVVAGDSADFGSDS